MTDLTNLYRWCDPYGGGLVIANSAEEAKDKVAKMLSEERLVQGLIIWPWLNDDYYDEENPDVFDIY